MTKRERIVVLSSLIMLLAGAGIFLYKRGSGSASNDLLRIDLTSFKAGSGWGYDIHVGPTFSIHQDHIPGINGYKTFVSEEEALKTGGLMVEKIKHKKPPSVSEDELKELGIHY